MSEAVKLSSYLLTELIFAGESLRSSEELFQLIHTSAYSLGCVREDFLTRIMEREATFPTGIQLEHIGVAIPHTDAECIRKEFIAIVINKEPILFKSMEELEQQVGVSIAFVLGLNQPHAQLEMLQSLMSLLQNEAILIELCQATSANKVLSIVHKHNL